MRATGTGWAHRERRLLPENACMHPASLCALLGPGKTGAAAEEKRLGLIPSTCPLKSPGWPMHELLGPGTMTVDHWMQSEVMMQSHMEGPRGPDITCAAVDRATGSFPVPHSKGRLSCHLGTADPPAFVGTKCEGTLTLTQ